MAYPNSKYNVRILGGARVAERILGEIPDNWTVLQFNELHPKEYLADLDVFVYFVHEHWVESFGRSIIEAMAAGVPVILPAEFEKLFKKAALYAPPDKVLQLVDKLMDNGSFYERQVSIARKFVQTNFGYTKHIDRITKILENVN